MPERLLLWCTKVESVSKKFIKRKNLSRHFSGNGVFENHISFPPFSFGPSDYDYDSIRAFFIELPIQPLNVESHKT